LPAFIVILTLASCADPAAQNPRPPDSLPAAKSAVFGTLLWQQDGDYGYAMLRPAGWMAADNGAARVYAPVPQPADGRLALSAVSYQGSFLPQNGEDVHWSLFRKHPALGPWADAVNQTLWKEDDIRLERELDKARIYAVRSEAGHIRFIAYVIDSGKPLVLMLEAGGKLADAERLRALGILDDFALIVESARIIRREAGASNPRLAGKPAKAGE